jgi:hypothetical protein
MALSINAALGAGPSVILLVDVNGGFKTILNIRTHVVLSEAAVFPVSKSLAVEVASVLMKTGQIASGKG